MISSNSSELEKIINAYKYKNYPLVQQLAQDYVKMNPLTEQGWVLLGDSLLHQGYGEMARKVYDRACLFNPQANWYGVRLNALKTTPKGTRINSIEKLLKPEKQSSVAAIILTKNEERCIARCLSSILEAVDEIIVIDTGSTDRTIEISIQFPKTRVVPYAWCDDFSAARNFGMTQTEANWVFWIDADESLLPEDTRKIKEAAAILHDYHPDPLLHITRLNHVGDRISVENSVPRIFPLRGTIRYHGRIHEQIGPATGNRYTNMHTHDFFVNIRIHHDGYDPDKTSLEQKLKRNIKLLQQMVDEEPEDPTWRLFLGRELVHIGEINKGIEALLDAEKKGTSTIGFGSLLEIQKLLVTTYFNISHLDKAKEVCFRMIETNPEFPDSYYFLAYIQLHTHVDAAIIEENLNKAKIKFQSYRGLVSPDSEIITWKADYLMAETLRLIGELERAHKQYLLVLDKCPESYKPTIKAQIDRIPQQ